MKPDKLEEGYYIAGGGREILIKDMEDEHLIKAYYAKLNASFDYYMKSLQLTNVQEKLLDEIQRRNDLGQDITTKINFNRFEVISTKEYIIEGLHKLLSLKKEKIENEEVTSN